MEESDENEQSESGDYSRFGIPDAPKTTITTAFGKAKTCAGLTKREKLFLFLSSLSILAAIGLTVYSLIHVIETQTEITDAKTCAGLTKREKLFLFLSSLSILAAIGLTVYSLIHVIKTESSDDPDFTFTILILVNAGFIAFYVIHGVIRERTYELYVQVIAIIILLVYVIVEYAIHVDGRTDVKLARLIICCIFAPPNIVLSILVARDFGELEFRIAGASVHLQAIYNQAAIFSCLLKFDLQVTVSLVIVVLKDGTDISTLEIITLAIGIPYTILWCIGGWVMLRLELKTGAFLFFFFGLVKPAYYIFKFIRVYEQLNEEKYKEITYIILICGALAALLWVILMVELVRVVKNFGQGLRDRGTIIT